MEWGDKAKPAEVDVRWQVKIMYMINEQQHENIFIYMQYTKNLYQMKQTKIVIYVYLVTTKQVLY